MDAVTVDDRALRRVVSKYAQALVTGSYDVGQVLFDLSDQCLEVLPVDGAGVSLAAPEGGGLEFLAATDRRADRVEDAQLVHQDGPCLTAFRTGKVVTVDDLRQDERWPAYRDIALDVGYRAVLAVPMLRDATVGSLDLYRDGPGPWSEEVIEVAVSLSNLATGYVTMSRALDDATTLNQQLQRALDVRVVVEQAKGILSGRGGQPPAEAYERIRAHARDHQLPVRDVARAVVDGTLRL